MELFGQEGRSKKHKRFTIHCYGCGKGTQTTYGKDEKLMVEGKAKYPEATYVGVLLQRLRSSTSRR